jgi:hypothetical protein
MLNTINSATSAALCCHPVPWNLPLSATYVMLPPSVQNIIHAEGVRCRGCGSI